MYPRLGVEGGIIASKDSAALEPVNVTFSGRMLGRCHYTKAVIPQGVELVPEGP